MKLPAVKEQSAYLTTFLAERAPGEQPVVVVGPATAGKTSFLRELEVSLALKGLAPIVVSPPRAEADSAAVAFAQVATALHRQKVVNGEFEELFGADNAMHAWGAQLERLMSWLQKGADKVVLLLDEPDKWARWQGRKSKQLHERMLAVPCRKVITQEGAQPGVVPFSLPARSEAQSWLNDTGYWGSLAPHARALADAHAGLDAQSPLSIRLLVGLYAHDARTKADLWLRQTGSRLQLSALFAEALRTSHHQGVLHAWSQLALARGFVPRPFVDMLTPKLSAEEREVLDKCVLYEPAPGSWALHETLRGDALRSAGTLDDGARQHAHAEIAGYFTARFSNVDNPRPLDERLLDELEAHHHAVHSGDEKLLDGVRPYFVDQLNGLACELSLIGQTRRQPELLRKSVRVYERSLQWDDADDYAHHYLAYNLDLLADSTRLADIEQHYRRAIELNPRLSRWHGRYISLLATLGRNEQAMRAWGDAVDAVGTPVSAVTRSVVDNLHLLVLRLLVHRASVDLAERVLDAIPAQWRREPEVQDLERRLHAIEEGDAQRDLLPLEYLTRDWWKRGPVLLPKRFGLLSLSTWMPSRIESVIGTRVTLLSADIRVSKPEKPVLIRKSVELKTLLKWLGDSDRRDIKPDRFVEIGLYGTKNPKTAAKLFIVRDQRELQQSGLPSDRYLHNA